MNKGFAGIILLIAIVAAVGLLTIQNNYSLNSTEYKELLPKTKSFMNEYELNLQLMMDDCNTQIKSATNCMGQDASVLLSITPSFMQCNTGQIHSLPDYQYSLDLNCIGFVQNNGKTALAISTIKKVTITKQPS